MIDGTPAKINSKPTHTQNAEIRNRIKNTYPQSTTTHDKGIYPNK
jgi:hypothetical protein